MYKYADVLSDGFEILEKSAIRQEAQPEAKGTAKEGGRTQSNSRS